MKIVSESIEKCLSNPLEDANLIPNILEKPITVMVMGLIFSLV